MLSSGMFARHQPHPSAPARRGGPARPCDSSVFPATSAISVLIPALSPKNPSFVFIRLRTLSFSVYNIFLFKLFAFNPFRTLSRNTGGGYQLFPKWNSTLSTHPPPTYSSSFFSHSCALFGAMGATQPFWNQFVPHSFYRNGGVGGCRHLPRSPRFNVRFTPIPPRDVTARYLVASTTPTLFTPLHARYTRPSFVAAMFRTVPPPDGIVARANACVFGSNRMSVFGFTPDSLYHTIPSGVMTIPYGADPAPPGEAHVFTSLLAGSSLPRCPRSKSLKYTLSSAAIASRRGRTPSGSAYSVIAIVFGSIFPSLFVPNSQKNGSPRLLICIPYGRALSVCTFFSSIFPVFGFSLPTKFPTCTVNHSVPSRSNTAVCGSSAFSSGILYSVTTPVRGSSFPMYPAKRSEEHTSELKSLAYL